VSWSHCGLFDLAASERSLEVRHFVVDVLAQIHLTVAQTAEVALRWQA